MNDITIRIAKIEDAEKLLDIYTPYITDTAITFEYTVPSINEFKERIKNTLKKYPYIVAERNNEIVGYAYAGPFKERAAYDWAVENEIIENEYCLQGYETLFNTMKNVFEKCLKIS